MGVERWFERKASHLRGEAKNHLDRSHFSVAASTNRPQIAARGRIPASKRRELRNGCQGNRRPKKSEEGRSSTFFTLNRKCTTSPISRDRWRCAYTPQ